MMWVVLALIGGGVFGAGTTWVLARQLWVNRETYDRLNKQFMEAQATNQVLLERFKTTQEMAAQTQDYLKTHFEVVANEIFQKNSQQFNQQSQTSIEQLVTPLKERFTEFNKKVEESFGTQAKEQFALKQEIEKIVLANQHISLQAQTLTRALKGDNRVQGNWGEILLEKILVDSGLRKNTDYVTQGQGLGLAHVETTGHLKPDIVVKLPDNKHIVIDSKVSLLHYERFVAEEEDPVRLVALKEFKNSLRGHIKDLESKRYQDTDKIGTPDFVMMFIPVEGAYMLAVQSDPEIHSYAWDKRIVLVCPSTLFATLRTVASLWRLEQQNSNAQEIAKRGGELFDKFVGFIDDMQKIGKRIGDTQMAYDDALNKLSTGRGNLINRAEMMRKLGVSSSKQLPEHLVPEPLVIEE
ncbi:MAG: DNA recombination protein RmuC [Alphaproteobacteria bacterium]|nr:DNA recombination protein RmuC [Alphaproteobacteria bacterium]